MDRITFEGDSPSPHFIGAWQLNAPRLTTELIDYFYDQSARHQPGITARGLDKSRKHSVDLTLDPVDQDLPTPKPISDYMIQLNHCYQDYIKQWPFLKTLGCLDVGAFNIQKYEEGGHFSSLHSERTTLSTSHRLLAWMTYLNTLDQSGETIFHHFGVSIKPTEGLTLIWPAEWTHAHVGNPVTSTKYVITGWFHFPPNNITG